MGKRDFTRFVFKMRFGWISHIAQRPRASILSWVILISLNFSYDIVKSVFLIVTKSQSDTTSQSSVTAKLKYAILQWANKDPATIFTCMRERHLRKNYIVNCECCLSKMSKKYDPVSKLNFLSSNFYGLWVGDLASKLRFSYKLWYLCLPTILQQVFNISTGTESETWNMGWSCWPHPNYQVDASSSWSQHLQCCWAINESYSFEQNNSTKKSQTSLQLDANWFDCI